MPTIVDMYVSGLGEDLSDLSSISDEEGRDGGGSSLSDEEGQDGGGGGQAAQQTAPVQPVRPPKPTLLEVRETPESASARTRSSGSKEKVGRVRKGYAVDEILAYDYPRKQFLVVFEGTRRWPKGVSWVKADHMQPGPLVRAFWKQTPKDANEEFCL